MSNKKSKTAFCKNLFKAKSAENFLMGSMLSPVHLEVKGNREAIVEGCKSIEEYDENLIRINVKKMYISFFGRGLEIKCLTPDSLVIRGFITSIEFLN